MSRLLPRLVAAWALAGGLLLIAIVVVTTANVTLFGADKLARLAGGTVSGLPGYEEGVRLAVSAAGLMFFPWCQLKRGHVTVELFGGSGPGRIARFLDRLWLAATVVLALFLLRWMVEGMLEVRADGLATSVLEWKQWRFWIPGILSLVLWALVAGAQCIGVLDDA